MDLTPEQIRDDLRKPFRGGLHFDDLTRGLYATDASPFHVVPLGVAAPLDADVQERIRGGNAVDAYQL